MLLGILMLYGCSSDEAIKNYISDLANVINYRDRETALSQYPQLKNYESFPEKIDLNNIKIEEIDDDTYLVSLSHDCNLYLSQENGVANLLDPRNFIKITDTDIAFLEELGMPTKSYKEGNVANLGKDSTFINYVYDLALNEINEKVKVIGTKESPIYDNDTYNGIELSIKNGLRKTIYATDFKAIALLQMEVHDENFEVVSHREMPKEFNFTGKISPDETQKVVINYQANNYDENTYKTKYTFAKGANLKLEPIHSKYDMIKKYYSPSGEEYNRFQGDK